MYKIAKDNFPKLYAALQNIGTLLLPCKNKSGHADLHRIARMRRLHWMRR